jgi:predicted lipoprotein with Yx(FWY)xxD motif
MDDEMSTASFLERIRVSRPAERSANSICGKVRNILLDDLTHTFMSHMCIENACYKCAVDWPCLDARRAIKSLEDLEEADRWISSGS